MSEQVATPEVQTPANVPQDVTPATPAPVVPDAPLPAIGKNDKGIPTVRRSAIISMFEMLGYADCHAWTPARLQKKISQIPDMMDPTKATSDAEKKDYDAFVASVNNLGQELKQVFDLLLLAVKTEMEIELISDREAKKKVDPKTPKAAKTPKAPKEKKAATPKKVGVGRVEGGERDAFGCAKGTRGYEAMALLTRDNWLKVKEIVKTCNREGEYVGVFYNFLNDQVKKGNVKKGDKGYSLTAAGEKLKIAFEEAKKNPPVAPDTTTPQAQPDTQPQPEAATVPA